MILAPCQCPLCYGDCQHEDGCALKDKEHIYIIDGVIVDWRRTLMANKITVPRTDRSRR